MNCATFTPSQKIKFIRDQIQSIRAGKLSVILCPYCGGENTPVDEKVCCQLFGEACMAIMDRIEKQEAIDFLEQVQDRVN